jgi:hypothetical protein
MYNLIKIRSAVVRCVQKARQMDRAILIGSQQVWKLVYKVISWHLFVHFVKNKVKLKLYVNFIPLFISLNSKFSPSRVLPPSEKNNSSLLSLFILHWILSLLLLLDSFVCSLRIVLCRSIHSQIHFSHLPLTLSNMLEQLDSSFTLLFVVSSFRSAELL